MRAGTEHSMPAFPASPRAAPPGRRAGRALLDASLAFPAAKAAGQKSQDKV